MTPAIRINFSATPLAQCGVTQETPAKNAGEDQQMMGHSLRAFARDLETRRELTEADMQFLRQARAEIGRAHV